ncbi:MAG: hypothetical protein RIQ60_4344 [Pseudomonadota bacterium]|jgi:hypothetical protein
MKQTGRADLLRALARGADAPLVIDDDGAFRSALLRRPVAEPEPRAEVVDIAPVDLAIEVDQADPPQVRGGSASMRLPLRMPGAWVMELLTTGDVDARVDAAVPLPLSDLEPAASEPVGTADLVPWARAMPALRRHGDIAVDAGIDWPRLLDRLARRELPGRLPRRAQRRWPEPLVLVLDCSPRLTPYRDDFHALARRIHAALPDSSLSLRTVAQGPGNGWRKWQHPRHPGAAELARLRRGPEAWRVAPGATVIVASDLGAFQGGSTGGAQAQWIEWSQSLHRQGARLIALAPVSPQAIAPELLQLFTVVRWSADSRWQRERHGAAVVLASGMPVKPPAHVDSTTPLDQLLALGATALRIDPPLLRAWCGLLQSGGGDAGLEGRFWNHPDVQQQALSCAIRPERLSHHLAAYARLPQALRDAAHKARRADHAHLRGSMNLAEDFRHATAAQGQGSGQLHALESLLSQARGLAALAPADRQAVLQAAQLIQSTAVDAVRALDPALFAALDALIASVGAQGWPRQPHAPDALIGQWQWVQQGNRIFLDPQASTRPGQRLTPPFELTSPVYEVWATVGRLLHRQPARQEGLALPTEWLQAGTAEIGAGPWRWRLQTVEPPAWAEEAELLNGQLFLGHRAPNGQQVQWQASSGLAQVLLPGQLYVGSDAYGLYADLTLTGRIPITQRLRYIPPGHFLMGSPEGVGDGDEHPQHEVTLTEGYWLADTPCTQALWQAVMGDNPSRFKDGPDAAERPVEKVSWDDVQTFLQRLHKLLPSGCEPTLPTEAQWEYAARAGTRTAYWWGDETDGTRANWNQQHKGTTPVRQFAPNPWGLHDMHGNVWEWCLDDRRKYAADPVRDPHGDLESSRRAMRGGSWFDHPDDARSAYRDGGPRDDAHQSLGFRLSLRSPAPGPQAPVAR